jgi:hypothetical protein
MKYRFGRDFLSQPRKRVSIKKSVIIIANNGQPRKLTKGQIFHFCGCDKGGRCVLYTDKPPNTNPDGTTFFGNIPSNAIGVKPGKTLFGRWRGAKPLRVKPKKIVGRKIQNNPGFDRRICHGGPYPYTPGTNSWCAGLWEYIALGGGKFTTGAESPASYWVKGKKVGRGFNTGLFSNGMRFNDVCVTKIKTPIRLTTDPYIDGPFRGTGTASWVFGYVNVRKDVKVWTWMIESATVGGKTQRGNIF